MLRTMGRSSSADSHGRDGVEGLRGLDANFRTCGVGSRGRRRLFVTALSSAVASCSRSVVGRIGRGALASSQCWLRSHNYLI